MSLIFSIFPEICPLVCLCIYIHRGSRVCRLLFFSKFVTFSAIVSSIASLPRPLPFLPVAPGHKVVPLTTLYCSGASSLHSGLSGRSAPGPHGARVPRGPCLLPPPRRLPAACASAPSPPGLPGLLPGCCLCVGSAHWMRHAHHTPLPPATHSPVLPTLSSGHVL